MDSKGYVRLKDNTSAENTWEVIKALKANNSGFEGESMTFWAARAKTPQLVAKTSRLRELAEGLRSLRPPINGGSYVVCSKKLRLLSMPDGDCVARIPYAQTGVVLNEALLASSGITAQALESKATELANARQWL